MGSGANIQDGMAFDYAQHNKLLASTHDFDADVISAATFLSEHYHSFSPHIQTLSKLSIKIFDAMKQEHGLGKRARLLLQVATILHDCGKYVSFAEASESTYHIIMSSEIIGLTHQEREIVAQIVRYNTLPLGRMRSRRCAESGRVSLRGKTFGNSSCGKCAGSES